MIATSHSDQLKRDDVKYVWHHYAQMKEYSEEPLVLEKAEGVCVEDIEGRKYIDAVSGVSVANIGYGNRQVIDAMKRQLDKLTYNCLLYSSSVPTISLARKLAEITPKGLEKVFFTDSGSDAVEAAIKMARQYHYQTSAPTKFKTISRWISYHGSTIGALSATGRPVHRQPFAPLLLDFPHIPPPYCYRCPFGKEYPSCDLDCARYLETTMNFEGSENISSFIAEPIIGLTGAGIVPPDEYFPMIREICDRYNVLLILDEVITGFGRTGKMFACMHWNVTPDILVGAKGITSGYAPMAITVTKPEIWEAFWAESSRLFSDGHTYGGNPLSCSAALEVIDVIEKEGLVEKSASLGEYLRCELEKLDHKIIGDVRGKGLLVGVELVKNQDTKETFDPSLKIGAKIARKAFERGVKIFGMRLIEEMGDFLCMCPPLIIKKDQIDTIINVVDQSMTEVEKSL